MHPVGRRRTELIVVGALALALFSWIGQRRIVDDDEGYYLLAGQAVFDGLVPYRDFFFPQMPLSAYLYGAWQWAVGVGIAPARYLTAGFGAATAVLVFHAARRSAGSAGGITATLLFLGHLLVLEWMTTVKTHPPMIFFTMATLVVLTGGELSPRRALAAGLLAGVAFAFRLTLAPLFLVVASTVCWRAPLRSRSLGAAAGGCSVAMLGVSAVAASHPARFWFGNLGYHALRYPGDGWVKDAGQKWRALDLMLNPLNLSDADGVGLQTLLLLVATASSVWLLEDRSSRAFSITVGLLFLVGLLPSPVWTQYATVIIAPAAVVAAHVLHALPSKARRLAHVLLGVYLLAAIPGFSAKVVATPVHARPVALDDVGRLLASATTENGVVAGHFAGYLVAADRPILAPARSQFSRLAAARLSPEARKHFGVETDLDMETRLLAGEADAIAFGWIIVPRTALALRDAGWTAFGQVSGVPVWVRPARATRSAH